jgi:hypothetical protein
VRKSKLPLKKLYTFVSHFLKRVGPNKQAKLFGSIKQKIGSSFKLLREDLARKASLACAILWNFWVLETYLFFISVLVSCTIATLRTVVDF